MSHHHHDVALDATLRILQDMKAGALPGWIAVRYSGYGMVQVDLTNPNQHPRSDQIDAALTHLQAMAPHSSRLRHRWSGGQKRTVRGVIDRWDWIGYFEPRQPGDHHDYRAFMTVDYDERHTIHEWRAYGPHGEADPAKAVPVWKCGTCGRKPTKGQREAAGIPS